MYVGQSRPHEPLTGSTWAISLGLPQGTVTVAHARAFQIPILPELRAREYLHYDHLSRNRVISCSLRNRQVSKLVL
jgi:hypothetical protein